jgi:uncharacterized membrane protein HdeD (DUF308 family)
MKNIDIRTLINRFLAPALVILLGLVLIVNPDSASALIAKLMGWVLIAIAIGLGISAITSRRSTLGKGIAAVMLAVVGGWLTRNPLLLAAWIGRFIGILLMVDGIQDILYARSQGRRHIMPVLLTAVGAVLILLPLTTSRLVFRLCGIVVLILGTAMLADRLKERKALDEPEDPNVIDAL